MKNNHTIFLSTIFSLLITPSLFGQALLPEGYLWFQDQLLAGDNESALIYSSNWSKNAQMVFMEKDSIIYGAVRGLDDGKFGLTDATGEWFVEHENQIYTKFYVGNDEKMTIQQTGNVGIGTDAPMHKLDVCGTIRAVEVLVEDDWCDYVFEDDYHLPTLKEEKNHIEQNGYLLGFESEEAMDGKISLHDVTKRQQVKIEEYALQLIQLSEKVETLEKQNQVLTKKYDTLEDLLLQLQNQKGKP